MVSYPINFYAIFLILCPLVPESEQMLANADKPDWMKKRDAEERGSFRSNARAAQAELNAKEGFHEDAGYYSMSDDDDDDDDMMNGGDFQISYQPQKSY